MTGILLAGALVGLGLTLILAGLRTPVPDLAAAVARLTSPPAGASPAPPAAAPFERALTRLTERMAVTLRLDQHGADLALTGSSVTRMASAKLGYAAVGLTFPVLMVSILTIAGLAVPFAVPVAAGLALGAAMSFLPEVELRRRAALARLQMRRTVCVYLELVALERAADAGAVESLERAAAIGAGPGFEHIRDALLRARLEGRTPWQQLSTLADELAVPELGDVADIMRLSGEDGAAVLPTLRARAASLRTALLQADVAAANEASERMSVPVALLGVAFMALLGFPALWRILLGSG
ncbi:MAG TPA: hypothetical protein VF143_03085 [Candidatus Nanopelagicales bacterium]